MGRLDGVDPLEGAPDPALGGARVHLLDAEPLPHGYRWARADVPIRAVDPRARESPDFHGASPHGAHRFDHEGPGDGGDLDDVRIALLQGARVGDRADPGDRVAAPRVESEAGVPIRAGPLSGTS